MADETPPVAFPLVQAILLVDDLQAARRRLEGLGLAVSDGGRHPGRGTANLIVPFGRQYLEVLGIVDDDEARSSPQGLPVVAALSRRGPGLARWSVEATDISSTAVRLGLDVEQRSRIRPDGVAVTWRSVGVDEAWAEPWRCSFMAWDDPEVHPARTSVAQPNGATGFDCLDVAVPSEEEALAWLGGPPPPGLALSEGSDFGPRRLSLASPSGPIPVA